MVLTRSSTEPVIPSICALFGEALRASQITLFQNIAGENDRLKPERRYVWRASDLTHDEIVCVLPRLDTTLAAVSARLAQGETVAIESDAFDGARQGPAHERAGPAVLIPVFVDDKWWGEVEIDRPRDNRPWSTSESEACELFGTLVGAAVVRARTVKELADAARVIDNSATILFRISAQKPYAISYVSPNITHYGYSVEEFLESPQRYLELTHPEDRPRALANMDRIATGPTTSATADLRLRASDGRYLWFEVRMSAVRDINGLVTEIEGLAIDIDRRKATDSYIVHFRSTDQLTGLPNRTAFLDEVRHAFAAAKRGAKPFSILYIDLDHFKDVNDVLGHSKGDALLKMVAVRLQGAVRTGDIVARLGGDEFGVLQLDIADPSDAGALASRVLRELAQPPYDLGTQVEVTASIGIAFFDRSIVGPEEMIKHADVALYRAKDAGRNQFHFHSEALDIAVIERVTMAADLRLGLERGELELYYQPQVDIDTNRIVGLEALARWRHPKLGLLLPSHFIPVAEKSGTIVPLGRWVIEQVCRQIRAWQSEKLSPPRIALNVSAVQMNGSPEFDAEIMHILAQWNIDPSAVALELTESVLMATTPEHRDIINRLNRLGIAISIDDFGTGYSSLGYLRAYRVSQIKIAQEFIRNIATESGDLAIVRAAISLARELGIDVIAEGVESSAQLALLKQAGCRYVQGFYFSPPRQADELIALLRRGIITTVAQSERPD